MQQTDVSPVLSYQLSQICVPHKPDVFDYSKCSQQEEPETSRQLLIQISLLETT